MVKLQKKRTHRWFALAAWAGLTLTSAVVAAQAGGQNAAPPGRKPPPGFEKFEPAPESEQVNAGTLVVLAYGAVFFGLFGYVVYVARSQAEMSKEMAELAARIDKVNRP